MTVFQEIRNLFGVRDDSYGCSEEEIVKAARSEERFDRINEKLGLDWDYNSLEDE